ncbi:MAG: adenylate/guanylate cyclase domain-containing protein [Pseudomonadota bacterium]
MKLGLNLFVGQLIAMLLVVAIISIGVIFSFNYTNHQALLNNQKLMLEENEKNLLSQINHYISMANRAEKGFYAQPNQEDAKSVVDFIEFAIKSLEQLKIIKNISHNTEYSMKLKDIESLLQQYQSDYNASLLLWKNRGLSRESGVGLELRTIAYSQIRSYIPKYNTQILRALTYKLRWLEYEFYLYGKKYIPKIKALLVEFDQELLNAHLDKSLNKQLTTELQAFKKQLESIAGVKGVAKDHKLLESHTKKITKIINTHSIENFTSLFRTLIYFEMEYRELGQQQKHVLGIQEVLQKLKYRVQNAAINVQDKNNLLKSIDQYQHAFLLLVELDKQILLLKQHISKTVTQLDAVIQQAIINENQTMQKINNQAITANNYNTRINIIVMAVLLLFTILFISWIVKRLGGKVKQIGSSLAQISAGDLELNIKLPEESKRDELDWISQHVVDVSKKLTVSINNLEKRNIELEVISNKLAKYLSPQVYKSIFTGQKSVQIQSGRKKLSVFFSDIVGFTQITDTMESEELTIILNDYLNQMSKIALEFGGTIDKFIGDAIMIFFGDPQSLGQKQDSINCVSMAIAMQQKIKQLQAQWQSKYGFTHSFQVRMGISSGYCTVGNFGSEERMDYTIIGGIVNLASRLERDAKVSQILISEETYLLVKDYVLCCKQDKIHLKGISHPIQSYQAERIRKTKAPHSLFFERSGLGYKIQINPEQLTSNEISELAAELKQLIKES